MNRIELCKKIINASKASKEGHIASSFSILDFLIVLYDKILTQHDDFVLSKGHASLGLYAVLQEKGLISEEDFFSFSSFNSILGGHPSSKKIPTVKISTGSLGHGLPFSCGLSLGKKIKSENGKIYCLIGDGEANEGTTWESALAASSCELSNLICVMDFNKSGERAIKMNSPLEKFKSFGWNCIQVKDGHDQAGILDALNKLKNSEEPSFIQLDTIKGKGCTLMENNPEWHHKYPSSEEELNKILKSVY